MIVELPSGQRDFVAVYGSVVVAVVVLLCGPLVSAVTHSADTHLNARWAALDKIFGVLLVLQTVVSFGAVWLLRFEVRHVEMVFVEGLFGVVWVLALAWLCFRVTPRTTVDVSEGNTFLAFLVVLVISRGLDIRAIAFAELASALPFAAAAVSLLLLVPCLVCEGVQRYWQVTFVGSLLSERERQMGKREPCRENNASLLARLTFSWIDALLLKARNKALEDEDIWDLADKDKTQFIVNRFKSFQQETTSLAYALLANFKWRIIAVFTGCVVGAILDFSKTFFLNRIIVFLQSSRNDQDEIHGFMLLAGLLLGQLVTSTVNGWVFYLARRNAINLRSTLVSEVYEKALRRSAGVSKEKKGADADKKKSMFDKPDQKANIGKIVSLMSSDANRLYNFAGFIHRPLVDLPISCIISVSALLYLLGPSALAGLLVVMVSGPLTGLISKYMIKEQLAYASATDNRTQVINEALQGVRIIKYFGWEEEFVKRISQSRENELSKAKNLWVYFIGYIVIAWGGSILVVFSSFFCYTVIAGHVLDPATAFTSVTLLHQVGVSLNVLPMIGMQ
ncbi:hypothetical protein HDU98_005153, partial [Podochytrium sp. JEL0797]